VRRLRLQPGEATLWRRDPCHRVSVVLSGDRLQIEFRDHGEIIPWNIATGEVDWSEPSDRVNRTVNVGRHPFEEVVIFLLEQSKADPQSEETQP
jgi:hypothetical protein